MGNNVTIYISLDDSGTLCKSESCVCFAGLVFLNIRAKDTFVRKYKKIYNRIKCSYCNDVKESCLNNCVEIKNYNIRPEDKRQFMNIISKEICYTVVIENNKIYNSILQDVDSRGRFTDYAKKRIIKQICSYLIDESLIDPSDNVYLVLSFDESITRSNGYYALKDGLIEELKHGVYNFDYGTFHKPILVNLVGINLTYFDSKKNYSVQAADFVAGTVRKEFIIDNENYINNINFVNILLKLPQ